MLYDEVKVSLLSLQLIIALIAYVAFAGFAKEIAAHVELLNPKAGIEMVEFQQLILLIQQVIYSSFDKKTRRLPLFLICLLVQDQV